MPKLNREHGYLRGRHASGVPESGVDEQPLGSFTVISDCCKKSSNRMASLIGEAK